LTQSLLLNFVGAPKTSRPPKPKSFINRSGKAVLVFNGFPPWFSSVSGYVFTVSLLMGTCESDSRPRDFALVATIAHSTPPLLLLLPVIPQSIRQGYWASSLLSYGFQGNTGPTKPLRSEPCPALPELFDSLTSTIANSLRSNKAQHAYLRDRYLSSYAHVVAWIGTSWRWQLPELPPHLSEALRSLILPQSANQFHYFRVRPGTRRLHPVLLEPTHRNSDCLNQQCPTGLSVRHRLQTLAALSSSPISNAADSHHQDFFPSALSWSH